MAAQKNATESSPVVVAIEPPAPTVLEDAAVVPLLIEPPRGRLSMDMWIAVIVTGLLALLVCIAVSGRGPGQDSISYRVGLIVGAMTVWPAVVIGLFSIGRQFRSPKARAVILLSVWGLTIVGQFGNLVRMRVDRIGSGVTKKVSSLAPLDDGSETSDEVEPTSVPAEKKDRAVEAAPASELDFSQGSDERFIKQIETAQQERYRRVAAAYRAACDARPRDALLALERVRFLEHFADAEDIVIESARADYRLARDHLEKHFPDAPGTVLFLLEHSYGGEFTTRVAEHARRVAAWRPVDAARFYLLQAQRENATQKAARVETLARKSFELQPTPEAGVLLAQALSSLGRKQEAVVVLEHAVFSSEAPNWIKKQRMDLLFDLDRHATALDALAELRRTAPLFVHNHDLAARLARAGRVAEGRTLLTELSARWNAVYSTRQRFEFELEFGDATQAADAYHRWRDTGFWVDPLGRERFELLRKHPFAGWSGRDVPVFGLLAIAIAAAALLPLLIIAPVHYWSLWRERQGKVASWLISPWGLWTAWWVLGAASVGQLTATWYFHPHLLQSWGNTSAGEPVAASKPLAPMIVIWTSAGLAVLAMLWRSRAWRLIGAGKWKVLQAVGIGLGFALALRVAVFAYVIVFPSAASGLAQISPVTNELLKALKETTGAWGLLGVIAVFVPLLEELLFRGLLLGAMARHIPFAVANALQALAFAALHESLLLLPFFFGFALLAGVLVRRSEGLLPAIVMHACNNAVAGAAFLFVRARMGF